MAGPRILITRAIDDAAEVEAAIQARGGISQSLPLHHIVPVREKIPAFPFDALLATSAQAFHERPPLPSNLFRMPLFCVGKKTAGAAQSAGFTGIQIAENSAETLLALIEANGLSGKSLLYLAGMPRRSVIEDWAIRTQTSLSVVQRYRIEPLAHDAAAFLKVVSADIAAILHFSPESARRFADEARRHDALRHLSKPLHVCFSIAVAEALRTAFLPQSLCIDPVVAASPSVETMLDAAFSALAFQSGD